MLHPGEAPRTAHVQQCLAGQHGPFIAATDYMRTVPDQIREWVPGRYVVLGTDGFGRSDSRAALRSHFEVDRRWVTVAALKALADEGRIDVATVKAAIERFGIDPGKPNPVTS
jgi:pyruvate dehydrogenase E1 component